MKNKVDELVEVLNLLKQVDDTSCQENITESIRFKLEKSYDIDKPIILDSVLKTKIEESDSNRENESLKSALWVSRFMMIYYNTRIILNLEQLEEAYNKANYNMKIEDMEDFIVDVADSSTSKKGDLIYSVTKSTDFWREVKDAVMIQQLVVIRLNKKFTILAGVTEKGVVLRTNTGKKTISFKKLKNSIVSIISIYSAEF